MEGHLLRKKRKKTVRIAYVRYSILRHMQITPQYPGEGLLKLLIRQSVAERIHGTVGVAQKV